MKYVPPLGATDPNASYQDGNPEAGILGSIVPAAAIERPQREILNVLTAAGLTPSDTDLTQLLAAIRKIIGTQNAELERLRLLKIGCPMYWRSTTLPEGFAWVNGDLVLFEDWPEFAAVYNAGGFSGMVLPYDADSATIAANLGKFRPNAANPTGLYLPSCGEQFFRAWTGGSRAAGSAQGDAMRRITGAFYAFSSAADGVFSTGEPLMSGTNLSQPPSDRQRITLDSSRTVPTAAENRPVNVALPVVLYLGLRP
ncbi:hypothetical protein [Bilophila wadsworthia]